MAWSVKGLPWAHLVESLTVSGLIMCRTLLECLNSWIGACLGVIIMWAFTEENPSKCLWIFVVLDSRKSSILRNPENPWSKCQWKRIHRSWGIFLTFKGDDLKLFRDPEGAKFGVDLGLNNVSHHKQWYNMAYQDAVDVWTQIVILTSPSHVLTVHVNIFSSCQLVFTLVGWLFICSTSLLVYVIC